MILLVTFSSFLLICSEKFDFSSSNRPRCFWVDFLFIGRVLKKTTRWLLIFFLRQKITSWACLETSGLNDIFHWYAHWEIFDKSSLSLLEEFEWPKNLGLESNPSGKSYMYNRSFMDNSLAPVFWKMSSLDRNIFHRDQDVLT